MAVKVCLILSKKSNSQIKQYMIQPAIIYSKLTIETPEQGVK